MKIGLLINPIAGMGGSVGLKGTDGIEILAEAVKRGAVKNSELRTKEVVTSLINTNTQVFACEGSMGGNLLTSLNIKFQSIHKTKNDTTEKDTKETVGKLLKLNVDLILFAGGDGTARNVCQIVEGKIPVIGIPTGVKIHSPVFCINPKAAKNLLELFLSNRIKNLEEQEVIDLDENEYRNEKISTKLFGYMNVPYDTRFLQCKKSGSKPNESNNQEAIAEHIIEEMKQDEIYLIGAGSTTKKITNKLNINGTLLGVDAIKNKKLIGKDLSEKEIIKITNGEMINIILTPIGGQGFIFGRGNQQFSRDILKQIDKKKITLACTKIKLNSLMGKNLLLDTGDEIINNYLSGYYKVITGYHEFTFYKVSENLD